MKFINLFLFFFSSSLLISQTPDLIVYNANIYNHEKTNPKQTAIAALNGYIIKVGSDEELKKLAGDKTEMLNAKGKFLMPGLIEGHGHFHGMGKANLNLNLLDTKNWDEIIDLVKAEVKKSIPGEWITGRGWHQEKWNIQPALTFRGFPYHDALSEVSPNNPVFLRHASGHLAIANQKAMELAGINSHSISPDGGEIFIDGKGTLVGVFNETAMRLFYPAINKSLADQSEKEREAYWEKCIAKAEEICLQNGITSFQDAGSDFEDIKMYRKLASNGELDIRLWVMLNDDIETIRKKIAEHVFIDRGLHFRLGGIKAYIDGALGSRGAWLLEPYSDMPDSHGHRIISQEDFDILASICKKYDLQLCTHAIGDRGNRVVFETYEKYLDDEDRRWRIEHAQHLHPDDIKRFRSDGIIAAMQPIHCTSDAPFVIKRLGTKRAKEGAYVWRKILDAQANLNVGTDTPVERLNPFANIYAACTRMLTATGDSFYPDQKLSRKEVLYYYTMGNAYSIFEEKKKGSLDPGKLADMIILDRDLMICSDDELLDTKVLFTIIGGEIKYSAHPQDR